VPLPPELIHQLRVWRETKARAEALRDQVRQYADIRMEAPDEQRDFRHRVNQLVSTHVFGWKLERVPVRRRNGDVKLLLLGFDPDHRPEHGQEVPNFYGEVTHALRAAERFQAMDREYPNGRWHYAQKLRGGWTVLYQTPKPEREVYASFDADKLSAAITLCVLLLKGVHV
jgi:hypothetical protein